MQVESRYMKRALRANGKGGLYLVCECGKNVSIPVISSFPMTYECECGVTYDKGGWIVARPGETIPY